MSSGATPLNRKRTHSLEQGSERSGPDVNSKKPRTSSGRPPSRHEKKKREKKRNAPEVEDIVQHRSGHRGKPRRVVESDDEEDVDVLPGPTPHSQVTRKPQHNAASTSSSPSLKGKEREADPVPLISMLDAEDFSKKTEELNQRLDAQTTKLTIHSALISSFKDSLTCQICVDLMYKPFTLAPCGHIACYSCLVGWFKSNVAEDEFGPQSVHRKKTCPHCRSAIRDRPIENFTIKEMVDSLVNSGVLEDVSGGATAISAAATSVDPWAGIFPKHPVMENNYDALPLSILDEGEAEDYEYEEGDAGVYDGADDVYRCRGCMSEVVDGVCTTCRRRYQPLWAAGPLLEGFFGGYGDPSWGDSDSDEGEEYFQEGYEESFIDEDEGVSDGPGLGNDVPAPPSYHEDEEDGDDEVTEVDLPTVARPRTRPAPIVISSDEDESDYTDAEPLGYHVRSWNEEEEEDGGYHDARSDSDGRGNDDYWSDEEPYNSGDHRSFYGFL